MSVSCTEVEQLFSAAKDKYVLLLLTEDSSAIPKIKPGIPRLSYTVLDQLTAEDGPLDIVLRNWAEQRPYHVIYRRWHLDRHDSKLMVTVGVNWLPQVRLVRRGVTLFRSSVSIGDNGKFLTQDVGGKSFRRRIDPGDGYLNLLDALSAEVDKPKRR